MGKENTRRLMLADGKSIEVDEELRATAGMPSAVVNLARNIDSGIYEIKDSQGRRGGATQVLEREDPSEQYMEGPLAGTDAFQRQLMALGIRTRGDWTRGLAACSLDEMYKAGGGRGAVLVPELMMRSYRVGMIYGTAGLQTPNSHALLGSNRFYASTSPVSESLRPTAAAAAIQADSLRAPILPLMVAVEEVTDGSPYESFVVTHAAASERFQRVGEGEPLRVISITGSTRTHRPLEYGAEIQMSDRVTSQWQLPLVQQHMAWIGEQDQLDLEQYAYEVIRDGDGSAGAATNTNVSALTGGVASTVTYANLMEWLRLFEGNGAYYPTVGICTSAVANRLDTSTFGSAEYPTFGPLGIALLAGQGAMPERRTFPPIYARSYSTANKLLCCDGTKNLRMKRSPLLTETDRIISRRLDKITFSYFSCFDIINDGGRRTLDTEN